MRHQGRQVGDAQLASRVLAYDIETIAPQVEDGSFSQWPTHRPIALVVAQAVYEGGQRTFDIDALVVGGDVEPLAA